ncbi:MAG: S8 family serine peptidase [Nocardioidaceae bacterium]
MSSRNRRWALPALALLGLLASGCADIPSQPADNAAAAPVVAPHVSIPRGSARAQRPAVAPARHLGASRGRQVRGVDAATPTGPATRATAAEQAWDRPRPSVTAPARTLLARTHVAAGAPVRVVSVRNVDGRPQVSVTTASDRPEATNAIARAQQAPGAVAVAVDSRVHAADAGPVTALAAANDTYRSSEWALTRLDAERLWAQQPGRGTIVAVVETGVDATHPDLTGDVLAGTDYVAPGGNGFADANGHGTHVAGIIAATANNHLGIAGLAQGVKILPVRALDGNGSGWDSDIAQGIVYATDHRASVVNLSLGGDPSDVTASAVSYALAHNVVVVAAAGNDGPTDNTTSYPAAYPGVLAVAASDSSDGIAYFSTRGSYVDVAAPGDDIVSTVPGGYAAMSGTSMATPYAAAAAALLHAADPSLSPDRVDSALEATADDLGAPGRDDASGFGLIDPRAALCAVTGCGTPTTTPSSPATTQPAPVTTTQPSTAPEPITAPDPATAPITVPGPSTEPDPVTAPDPTTAPQPVATRTRILSRSRVVRYGSRVRGTVAVSDEAGEPMAAVPVDVCLSVAGVRDVCRSVVTNRGGRAGYALLVRAGTTVTASFGGDEAHAASTSDPVAYTVAPRLSVRRHHRSLTVRLGADHRRFVTLQRHTHGRWVSTARARVAPGGRHVFRHLRAGRYRVRVPATRAFPGAHLALRLR